jgi:hypothetical protein
VTKRSQTKPTQNVVVSRRTRKCLGLSHMQNDETNPTSWRDFRKCPECPTRPRHAEAATSRNFPELPTRPIASAGGDSAHVASARSCGIDLLNSSGELYRPLARKWVRHRVDDRKVLPFRRFRFGLS